MTKRMTLKKQRRMVGLTQLELARLAEISYSRLTFFESRRLRLTSEERRRIRVVFAKRAEQVAQTVGGRNA